MPKTVSNDLKGGEGRLDIENLYREYYGFIFRFLMSLCRNENLAEELAHEAFFRAYINLRKLRDDGKAAAWLCQIAKNLYFAWYNDHKKLASLEDARNARDEFNVEETVALKESAAEAAKYLRELDDSYREVFMLHVFGELPLESISRIFGKSESWARVTFYRAKQKIIEKMGEQK